MASAGRERSAYLRSIPFKRLINFVAAGFCLFAAFGLLTRIGSPGEEHLLTGFGVAVVSGLFAVGYILASVRKRALMIPLAAYNLLGNPGLNAALAALDRLQPAVPFETALSVSIPTALGLILASYILFLRFIGTEGRFAFRAQTELALAHGIQQTLVPVVDVAASHWEIYGISNPSEKVGGDLVDAVTLPDGSAVAYLADISGHGLQAGILMGMVKTAIRTSLTDAPSVAGLFKTLNRVLPQVKEPNMYATCAALHLRAGTVEFALAGHPPILWLGAKGEVRGRLTDEQFPIGLFPFATYRSQKVDTETGDLFVVATDGILEVSGKDGVDFGARGFEELVAANASAPLKALAEVILAGAKAAGKQDDDQTLLLIRVL